LRSSFARQLRTEALKNRSFGEQLELALERNFGGQLSDAFGSNCGEQLSGAALENNFGEVLWGTGLKHAALGQPLCRDALWNSFGKQLRGIALGSSFGKLSRTTLIITFFEQQLSGSFGGSFTDNFGEQLLVTSTSRS